MEAFVSISETMAQALFGSGFGVAQSVSKVAGSASQAILSTVGLDNRTQIMIQSIKQKMSNGRRKIKARLPDAPINQTKKKILKEVLIEQRVMILIDLKNNQASKKFLMK